MIKKNHILLFFIALSSITFGQNSCLSWAKGIGSTSADNGNAIAVDASGNVITAGFFQGVTDFDPGVGIYPLASASASSDVFVSKLDPSGNFLWAVAIGSVNTDEATGVTTDASGNIYVTGIFEGIVDFDPGPSSFTLAGFGGSDVFVLKLDASGNFLWAKQLGGSSADFAYGIALDGTGAVLTCGGMQGTGDFDPGAAVVNLISSGSTDIFISKLNSSGTYVWAKRMGAASGEAAYAISVDVANNVYTTGFFNSTVDFDPGAGTTNLVSVGGADIFISKLDVSGNYSWAKKIGGVGNDFGNGIDIDVSGYVISTGCFSGNVDFDPGGSTFTLNASGVNYDAYVSKLGTNGLFVWAKDISNSSNTEVGNAIEVDAAGNIYTTGFFDGTPDFDPGAGTYNISTNGFKDVFINCLNSSGNFIWTKSIGGTGNDNGSAIRSDASGNIYIAGGYSLTPDFDPGVGVVNITSNGNSDVFIEKLFQLFTPTIIASPSASFCPGATITLSTSPAGSYTWNTGANTQTISVSTVGVFSIAITSSACSVNSSTISTFIYPSPTVAVTSGSICAGQSFTMVPSGASTYTFSSGTAIVSPSVSTSYSVSGTSTAGCISPSPAISNITVNPIPTITVNSGSICSGNSFTMVPGGAVTYTFSGGSSIVSPTTTTSYSVTGSSAGCTSTAPAVASITVNALPLPIITVNSGSICLGNSFTMTPGGANTYTFSGGSAIVSPTTNAFYTVSGTNLNGCTSTVSALSNVTVVPLPTITVNNGAICIGNSFTINPSGANSYTFSGGSAIVSPTVTTNYTVIGSSSTTGCNSAPKISSVTAMPLPTISIANGTICSGLNYTLNPSGASTYSFSGGSAIVTPTANTNYSVVGTSSAGCVSSNTAVATISIVASPTISVNSGTTCSNQSFTLVASGASTYNYPGNTQVVSPFFSTSFSITTTNSLGCVGTAVSNITVIPIPAVSINPTETVLCYGNTNTLVGSGALTFTWSTGSNNSFIIVTPIISTNYTLSTTDGVGCTNSIVYTQITNPCVGIQTNSANPNNPINIYPNPNTGNFFIELDQPAQIIICNTLGEIIFNKIDTNSVKEISISDLPNGVYFIKLINKENILSVSKIIKAN